MKAIKNALYFTVLCLHSFLYIPINEGTELSILYNGISFNSRIYGYAVQFLLFSCYSLYIYNEFETYVYQYGAYVTIREKSRGRLMWRITFKLLTSVFMLELIRIVGFLGCMLKIRGNVTFNRPLEFLGMFFIHFLIYILILFVQMMLEIYVSGKIALCITMAYYIVSIHASSLLQESSFKKMMSIIWIPNLTMKLRLDELFNNELKYLYILVFIITLLLFLYGFSVNLFKRKDILQSDY